MNAITDILAAAEPQVPTLSIAGERTLRRKLANTAIGRLLDEPDVDEIAVNQPHVVHYEQNGVWKRAIDEKMTLERCEATAIVAADISGQQFGPRYPLLYANLPDGERFTAVGPSVTRPDRISIIVRARKKNKRTWGELCDGGMFDETEALSYNISEEDEELLRLYRAEDWRRFFPLAIEARKNIVLLGPPKSGKTTTMETMGTMIPMHFRNCVIEDGSAELEFEHENSVRWSYSRSLSGTAPINASRLVEASLRGTFDLTMFGELRGEEAFPYFRAIAAGSKGITTAHGNSIQELFPVLSGMFRENPAASRLDDEMLQQWLRQVVDVGAHFQRVKVPGPDGSMGVRFRCTNVYFKTAAEKNRINSAAASL